MKIYQDKQGNTLHKTFIKSRGIYQYSAKNAEGKLVRPSDFNKIAERAGLKTQQVTQKGVQKVRRFL